MKHDIVYLNLLEDILENGIRKSNRTGTDTISVFGRMIDFNVSEYVPILTTKSIHLKSVIHELLWFLKGDTNIAYLKEHGVTIWNEWADEKGELKNAYGKMWRKWPTGKTKWTSSSEAEPEVCDQIQELIQEIKRNPNSRRLMVSAWNAPLIWKNEVALPACHYNFQIIIEDDKMSLMWNQRAIDTFLGLPYNVASYTILLYMIASLTGYKPHRVIGSLGDVHLYVNHLEQVREQLKREPYQSPKLRVNPNIESIDDFKFEDIEVIDYNFHPAIKAPVAV